jgi:hypothetical protein
MHQLFGLFKRKGQIIDILFDFMNLSEIGQSFSVSFEVFIRLVYL